MIKWNDSFVREIAERRVAIFIGSGISRAAHGALPGWSDLLLSLANDLPTKSEKALVQQLINKGRLLDAAQIITDGIQKADLGAKIRHIFQVVPPPHHTIYENLLKIDPKVIVTTNYDEFIEKNFEYYSNGNVPYNINRLRSTTLINDLRSPLRTIVKIHGCVTSPLDIVLDRASFYHARKDNTPLFTALAAIMTVSTILFLGYSVSDPDIQLLLESINMLTASQHPHYALVEKFEHVSIRRAMTQTYNIQFLEYQKGNHASVPQEIETLTALVLQSRASRGIV